MLTGTTNRGLIVGIVALAVSASCHVPAAIAEEAGGKQIYYVDFRARTAATFGHAFIWYGRLDRKAVDVAGLHPATDNPIPYIIGQILPVPSETGASYGDLDEGYLLASYRVTMTEAQARPVFAEIKRMQASTPLWNNSIYNCVSFIQDIARFMGLKVPNEHAIMPDEWVEKLRALNGGRENQLVSLSQILSGTVPKYAVAPRPAAGSKSAAGSAAGSKSAAGSAAAPKSAAARSARSAADKPAEAPKNQSASAINTPPAYPAINNY
jgi:hypothetical protein